MELMKVKEYSKAFNVSVQSVYQRINKGTLEIEIKDGIKYIKVIDQPKKEKTTTDCKEIIKIYKSIIKDLKKQIARIEKDKDRSYANLEKLFERSLGFSGVTSLPSLDAEVFEVKKKKKEKKKKK
jgi:hypothetical protein